MKVDMAFCAVSEVSTISLTLFTMPCARLPGSVTTHCACMDGTVSKKAHNALKIFRLIESFF